jgi:polar amino acid transport system substrate-binding protein
MLKTICAALVLAAGALTAAAQTAVTPEVLKDLAPGGKLRAAINVVNTVLAQEDPAGGEPKGITVDLSRELARRLGVPLELVIFRGAGTVFQAAKSGRWDVAFFAIEPVRAAEVDFSSPYVLIEGGYVVPKDSPIKLNAEVDRPGVRVAVGQGSAYDLYLTRTLKNATLMRTTASLATVTERFLNDKLEVIAGVKIPLAAWARARSDMRVLDGAFQEIRQAMGTPKGRDAGARYLRAFVEGMKASGFVADALKRSNQPDAAVAPAGG